MNQTELNQLTVGEIVTNDFRTSEIFKNAGIDFCCGGKQTLEQACLDKGIEPDDLKAKLDDISNLSSAPSLNYKEWEPAFLSDYIVNTHHRYVQKNLPELVFYTKKIASVHGENHPELVEIEKLFGEINRELLQHLKNEEEVLFPAIKQVAVQPSAESKKTITSEITRMLGEHDFAGGAMDQINVLSKGYHVPEDACNTYRVALKLLEQFEDDLHVHVHLENNILFPKALQLAID